MPRLIELDPQWLKYEEREDGRFLVPCSAEEANGIKFLCPKCFSERGTDKGVHTVICWSRSKGTPDGVPPEPGRWTFKGNDFNSLTVNGDPEGSARSILLIGGCNWHGFITDGVAE